MEGLTNANGNGCSNYLNEEAHNYPGTLSLNNLKIITFI